MGNIRKYLRRYPLLRRNLTDLGTGEGCVVYSFSMLSLYSGGDGCLELYRGKRRFKFIEPSQVLTALHQGARYLARLADDGTAIPHRYLPKIDETREQLSVDKSSMVALAMPEAYRQTHDQTLLVAARRTLRHLLDESASGETKAALLRALCAYQSTTGSETHGETLQLLGESLMDSAEQHAVSSPLETAVSLLALFELQGGRRCLSTATDLIDQTAGSPNAKPGVDHSAMALALSRLITLESNKRWMDLLLEASNSLAMRPERDSPDPDHMGACDPQRRSAPAALVTHALCEGYRVTRLLGYTRESAQLRNAALRSARFQLGNHYWSESCLYLPNPLAALGGFRHSVAIYETRTADVASHVLALSACYNMLSVG